MVSFANTLFFPALVLGITSIVWHGPLWITIVALTLTGLCFGILASVVVTRDERR